MKTILLSIIFLATTIVAGAQKKASTPESNVVPNTLTKSEIAKGWKLLWDGKTTTGWRGAGKTAFPAKGWKTENGTLTVEAASGTEAGNGGDIVTIDEYSNFELVANFKITKGANSGIKYFVTEAYKTGGSAIGPEFQVLDDANHPDAKLGVKGNRTIGSLYDLIPAISTKKVNPIGEWNQARIIVKGSHVEHWLNGIKVVEYERKGQMFEALVAYSKFKNFGGFGEAEKGHILLQDHGNEVSFRNVKIREIK